MKNYNKSLIEINEDINKMIYYVYGLEDSILLRYHLFFILIYRFNKISIKIIAGYFVEIRKLMLKFI